MIICYCIMLLVVLMFFVLFVIGVYVVYQMCKSVFEVCQVIQGIVLSVFVLVDFVVDVKNIQIVMMMFVYVFDVNIVVQVCDELKVKQVVLCVVFDVQVKLVVGCVQEGFVVQVKDSVMNYFVVIDDIVKMKMDGKVEMVQVYLFVNVVQYCDEFESIVDMLCVEKNCQKDDVIGVLNGMFVIMVIVIVGVVGMVIVLLIVFGFVLYCQIMCLLIGMQMVMSEIVMSQDFMCCVLVGWMDEIGYLIVVFNGMIEKIQENVV